MQTKLHPQYIAGFVDGEGSFHIAIYQDKLMKTGLKIIPELHVSQRSSSKNVLESLVKYFGCGYIKANHAASKRDTTLIFVVRNRRDLLDKIIPFFNKYPLQTEKQRDFRLFSLIVKDIDKGKHRTLSGLKRILKLAYQMNQSGKYRRHQHKIS